MKSRGKKGKLPKSQNNLSDSESDVGDIFTDEISEFTDARNKIDLEDEKGSDSEEEEEMFALRDDEEDESDEEIGEWSKRLKQIKFQTKLDKKKALPDAPEKSWGSKRTAFYGSGVKRKPKKAASDEEDEWTMEEREIEKLQKKLDEDIDEEDFLLPSFSQAKTSEEKKELSVKRDLSEKEKEEVKKRLHPEAEPLREELNKCLEELEKLKDMKGWKVESRDTCFRLLAANIAFYLHLIDNNEDCRGHPVLKRIVQWKKLAKMYEAIPMEQMEESDEDGNNEDDVMKQIGHRKRRKESGETEGKRARLTLDDSEDEDGEESEDGEQDDGLEREEEMENRPITYEMEKNKPKKKTAPNNPRVKHREKFRKAKIRRRGKIREYRPEINKYQGEASGIRAGIVRSMRLK